MYGKIFSSIYDGTLVEDWRALITFQQFIVLCDADGIVDMTPKAISSRTGIPIDHIKAGIEVLEKADKYSRTPDEQGKRIELIDEHRAWGWHIINHEKYKNMRDADTIRAQTRERVRKHREKKRAVTDGNAPKRHIDKEIDTNIIKTIDASVPYSTILDLYHKILTELPRAKVLTDKRKRYIKELWKSKNEDGKTRGDMEWWDSYFTYCKSIKFLHGENERGWTANLEWIVKPENFVKIIEGNYK